MTLLATFPHSCTLDGLNPIGTIDAFSGISAKQHASAILWEEITTLNTKIREYVSQINAWLHTIAILKSLQNTLCGIAKLPADILINIWLYFAEDSGESVKSLKQWLGITHVCSHWRKLARNSQTLWKWPCILRPRLASSLLNLAGASPITLFVNTDKIAGLKSNQLERKAFRLAGRLLYRTDALTLKITNNSITDFFSDFVRSLKQKGIVEGLKFLAVDYEDLSRAHAFSVTELVNGAPELRSIFLRNRTILDSPSSMLPLPLLISLEIIILDNAPGSTQRLPLHKFLSTVGLFSNLHRLILVDAFQPLTKEDEEWHRAHSEPISFSSMQTLRIASSVQSLQIFFEQVAYPPTAEVTAEIASYAMNSRIRQSDSAFLHALELLIMTTCNTSRMGKPIRNLEVSKTTDEREDTMYYIGFNTRSDFKAPILDFFWPKLEGDQFPNLPGICPLDQVEVLYYDIDPNELDVEMWKAFGCLQNLKEIMKINVEEYPALLKTMSSFRPSGESIFEPAILTRHNVSAKQDQLVVPQLYFPKLVDVPQPNSLPAREYLNRIMLVRRAWNRSTQVEGN